MTAVSTAPALVGGSRAGSGTCWLQIVAGRVGASTAGSGACVGVGAATCALAAAGMATPARVTNKRTRARITGIEGAGRPSGVNSRREAKPRVYWILDVQGYLVVLCPD